jgi:hypothetical protein
MRSVSRITGVSINTVSKLLIDAGLACAAFHDKTVRGVTAKSIQADEIWSFSYAKQKNVKFAKAAPDAAGDVWTWTAIRKLAARFCTADTSDLPPGSPAFINRFSTGCAPGCQQVRTQDDSQLIHSQLIQCRDSGF